MSKEQIQSAQYVFPYHHIPYFNNDGTPTLLRNINWGLEYLCYQNHIMEKVISKNPNSVLEIGCGDGYFIGNLPDSIPVRVGVDLSTKAVSFAKAFYPDCTFYDQDAAYIEEQFGVVAAIEVIEHIPDVELSGFFKVLYERLSDCGRAIISVPTTVLPLNKKHYRHYTKELLEDQLQQSGVELQIVEIEHIFSKPWWYSTFKRILSNRLFSLEIKPLMRFAWRDIWRNHRIADEKTGFHLVAVLKKGND